VAENRPRHWLKSLLDMPNESLAKTILIALTVSLVCALMVSTTAVLLRPIQDSNRENERQQEILKIVERLPGIEELFESVDAGSVEAHVVEIATGNYTRAFDPTNYDQRAAARDPQLSIEIPPERDIAGIKRRARYATVYTMKRAGETKLIILPVHGGGYASTLYGFLALEGNANTVVALSFYEHGETPGMGARIDSAEWRNQWQGKKLYDEQGRLRIGVAKGPIDFVNPDFAYQVDGLTGATRTSDGVTNLLHFWLGDYGFGPYLNKRRP
jgi:Na+-transporting NADH:ubiquinone oxidoreductase subunit C